MIYIKTKPLNVYVFHKQIKDLKRIQFEINREYNIKIPISELVRQALEHGIPAVDQNRSFVLELVG